MAEFCTKCAPEIWGNDIPEDINIEKIFDNLPLNTYEEVLCEGCMLTAIGKTEEGEMMLAIPSSDDTLVWVSLEEFMRLPTQI